jgi:DNA-binding response OmpR family regulator
MHKTTETTNLKFGKAAIDLARREITWPSARIELSETEAALLKYLFKHRTRAVSREEILTNVWGIESEGLETRTIDMHVVRLRSKLRDPSGKSTPEAIVTVRATGYMAGPDLVAVEDEE